MENLILIKDIRQGCYSNDPEIRKNSSGGFMMIAGATYSYGVDPKWNGGKGFWYCGTHIISEQDIDMRDFIPASKYEEFLTRIRKEIVG